MSFFDLTSYRGNKKLKRVGVKQNFTPEQIQELTRCEQDPIYFINKYIKIISQDKGLIQMQTYKYQEKLIDLISNNRFIIAMIARQSGKTTAYVGYVVWYILFGEAKSVVILGNKAKTAKEILTRVKTAYEELPQWMQQGVEEWNKTSIILENKSKVSVDSTGGTTGRSGSINLLILDEFAFVPRNIAEDFMSAVYPTITAGTTTKLLIVSTPNGMNLFYKLYNDALKGLNTYIPFTVHWSDVPGRDDKWYKETVKNMGQEKFEREYECEFKGSSSNTLIPPKYLKTMVIATPIGRTDGMDVYSEPNPGSEYVITVDTSRGGEGDYSAFSVFDISKLPYRIVAKYRNNSISPLEYPLHIYNAAKKYNDALLLIELNDVGGQVADIIKYDYEYDNMFTTVKDNKIGQPKLSLEVTKRHKLGVTTTKTVKNVGCATLKSLVEESQIIIEDFDILSELNSFETKGMSFSARRGETDDLVMTLVLFSWLIGQKYFKELSQNSKSIRKIIQEKNEENKYMPILGNVEENSTDTLDPGDLILVDEQFQGVDSWMNNEIANHLGLRNK